MRAQAKELGGFGKGQDIGLSLRCLWEPSRNVAVLVSRGWVIADDVAHVFGECVNDAVELR